MISPIPFAIGLIIYVAFTIFTSHVYFKRNPNALVYMLFFIYFFYTLLAGYLIFTVDFEASDFENYVQTALYGIVCLIILIYYYQTALKDKNSPITSRSNLV